MAKTAFIFGLLLLYVSCSDNNNSSLESNSKKNNPLIESSKELANKDIQSPISFTNLKSSTTGIDFTNKIKESQSRNILTYDYFYNGAGVAIADFDNDGLADIFFCGNDNSNEIYKNKGQLAFENRTGSALPKIEKWSVGVTTVDINGDGLLDIYISNSGPDNKGDKLKNQLLVNKGNFNFVDQAKAYGLDISNQGVQAEFFDMDNDGDLDVWINSHGLKTKIDALINKYNLRDLRNGNLVINLNKLSENAIVDGKLRLLRNDGGKFTDISKAAGINFLAFGLGLSVADYNDDGFLDVYVANDYFIPDFLFLNNKEGGFTPDLTRLNHTSLNSKGSDAADYNNDGKLDLIVTDFAPKDHIKNRLLVPEANVRQFNINTQFYKFPRAYQYNSFQLGLGNAYFSDIAPLLEVGQTDWSWAPLLFDMDNDGYKDLYITNGYIKDIHNKDFRKELETKNISGSKYNEISKLSSRLTRNAIFHNKGESSLFQDLSNKLNYAAGISTGVAYGDLDNDGDLDLVINNLEQQASILRNDTKANFLKVLLKAEKASLTKHAQVTLFTSKGKQRLDNNFTRGYLSSMEPKLLFGLGDQNTITKLQVRWLDGTTTTRNNIKANQEIIISYDHDPRTNTKKPYFRPYFHEATNVTYRSRVFHEEVFHDDFEKEVLLPHKYSSLGPSVATMDFNKDGSTDFFIGGSKNKPGKFFMISGFRLNQLFKDFFAQDSIYEDTGSVFFDANGDGYEDLYVCSGGGTEVDPIFLQDRLYLNEKNIRFSKAPLALPTISSSTQAITVFDVDNDKDLDLFVGGRNSPGKYPSKAASYLLINDGGKFQTAAYDKFYSTLPNMVTGAEAADLNQDGYMDLIVVGEWSSPQIYINQKGKGFKLKKHAELEHLQGWWYSIKKCDFNKDGKPDFIIGNLGENSQLHKEASQSISLYYDDFDKNGTQDAILAKAYKGQIIPIHRKEKLIKQLPGLASKFNTHASFAEASLEELVGSDNLTNSKKLTANYFKSVILMNTGQGFTIKELPFEAQFAPILDMEIKDFDNDGHLDIIVAGSLFNTEPETPSYDAGNGLLLIGNGTGDFKAELDIRKTGINLNRNTKDLIILHRPGGYALLAANNNDYAQLLIRSE